MSKNFDAEMQAGLRAMQSTRMAYEAACSQYHAACIARNWTRADELRLEVISAAESALDAVMLVYRRLEAAEQNGR